MTALLAAGCVAWLAVALLAGVIVGPTVRGWLSRLGARRTLRATPWCNRCGARAGDVLDRGECANCAVIAVLRRIDPTPGWPCTVGEGGGEATTRRTSSTVRR